MNPNKNLEMIGLVTTTTSSMFKKKDVILSLIDRLIFLETTVATKRKAKKAASTKGYVSYNNHIFRCLY